MSSTNIHIADIIRAAREEGREQLSDIEAFEIMEAVGMPLAGYRVVPLDIAKVREAAEALGFPVVLKTISEDILHKTEIGGVIPDIRSPEMLEEAFRVLRDVARRNNVDSLLMQRMVQGELEVIVGGSFDSIFGETVMFGLGGRWVEVMKDVYFRLAPASIKEAHAMMKDTRIYPLLQDFRGRKALPVEELARLIATISELIRNYDIREIDLNPLILSTDSISCVDAKVLLGKPPGRTPVTAKGRDSDLTTIFNPKNVLLVGSSMLEEDVGMTSPEAFQSIIANMRNFYKGTIQVLDITVGDEETIEAVCGQLAGSGEFELAVFLVPPKQSLLLLRQLKDSIRNLVHLSSAPHQGTEQREEYIRIIRSNGIRVIGSNSILGVIDTSSGVNTSFERGLMPPQGDIAVLSQSGGVGAALLDWAVYNKIGISRFVFMGEKVDVNDVDILRALQTDRNTKVIAIYMEGIEEGGGREFISCAREVIREKPIVVLKGGITEAAAERAKSHTASTAGANDIFNGAFYEAGIIRVGNIESLFAAASTLSLQPPMRGRRAAVVSNVGGPAILAADALVKEGFELPELTDGSREKIVERYPAIDPHNPLDLIADADDERYGFILEAVLQDENIDGILLIDMMKSTYFRPGYARVFKDIVDKHDKPVVNVVPGGEDYRAISEVLEGSGIPCYNTPKKGAKALKTLVHYHENRERLR